MANQTWRIVAEPVGNNGQPEDEDPRNLGGMVISVTDGRTTQEVSRVAYARRHSKNPKTSFDKQLKTYLFSSGEITEVEEKAEGKK